MSSSILNVKNIENISDNGIRYMGNKTTINHYVTDIIQQICYTNNNKNVPYIISDLFSGTGSVGRRLQYEIQQHYEQVQLISNDLEKYSYVLNYSYLKCSYTKNIQQTILNLNNELKDINETDLTYKQFYNEYSVKRMFFTKQNGIKIQHIHNRIIQLYKTCQLTKEEYMFLKASLIYSSQKYANISGVFGAFLKQFQKNALQQFVLQPVHKNQLSEQMFQNSQIYNEDALQLLQKIDNPNNYLHIIYIDPPYNQRQYGANYSPLNILAEDEHNSFQITETTAGLIQNYNKSDLCSKTKATEYFKQLFINTNYDICLMSYNNESLLSKQEIQQLFYQNNPKSIYHCYEIQYKKFNSGSGNKTNQVIEYLFVFIKEPKISSPFQWVGSKLKIMDTITENILQSKHINNYYEPFFGSLNVIIKNYNKLYNPLQSTTTKFVMNDINNALYTTFKYIQNTNNSLTDLYKYIEKLNQQTDINEDKYKQVYQQVKDRFNELKMINEEKRTQQQMIEYIGSFMYLNKYSFNAVYRENSKGVYNVPVNVQLKKQQTVFVSQNIFQLRILLNFLPIYFYNMDYQTFLQRVQRTVSQKDFIYFDPPYMKQTEGALTKYNKNDFNYEDQINLALHIQKFTDKQCFCMWSNSYNEIVKRIYNDLYVLGENSVLYLKTPYIFKEVLTKQVLNSNPLNRQKYLEILYKNYDSENNITQSKLICEYY